MIKEAEEAREDLHKPTAETKANPVAAPTVVTQGAEEIESSAEEVTDEMDQTYDDLMDGIDYTESCEVTSGGIIPLPVAMQPLQRADESLAHEAVPIDTSKKSLKKSGSSRAKAGKVDMPDIEEAKSDLVQLDIASSKQNSRSWLTDLPSIESMMGRDPHKTFSDVSTIGDLSEGADGQIMISNINFYVTAASKAVQHNLYEVPVRELERLREVACCSAGTEEQASLMDKDGVSGSMSNDSIQASKRNPGAMGAKKSTNLFSIALSELVDVLECTPMANPSRKPTLSTSNQKFEEQKIEMFGSTSEA